MKITMAFIYPYIMKNICKGCKRCLIENWQFKAIIKKSEYSNVYAAKHISNTLRKNNASGGAFTALSDTIL